MKRVLLVLPWILILILSGVLTFRNSGIGESVTKPSPSAMSSSAPSLSPLPSSLSTSVKVTRIVDGDTVDLSNGAKLRYIGIDTPERGVCFADQATKRNKELVLDREVKLEKDISETDRYSRILRYVWIGDTMINEQLVREGFAKAYTYPPDVKYSERFVAAEREAREAKRGLWADNACSVDNSEESVSTQSTTTLGSSTSCQIKGNISTGGDKIYHLPGCGSYNKTSINESAGEHWFCSEDEAVNAGWRKAKNC